MLPPSRPVNDAAGRIIIFVIDDLHLDFRDTHRIRRLFRDMAKELIHEGDLFGIVSTGTSSIAIDLTYDRGRMEEAANRITGGGLKPSEIIEQSATGETPQEVMHRANVAFETVYDMLNNLQQTQNRRKAVVLISNGYDFDPFAGSRAGTADSVFLNNRTSIRPTRQMRCSTRGSSSTTPSCRCGWQSSRVRPTAPTRPFTRSTHEGSWPVATSTSPSTRSSGRRIFASRRTACACWPS